MTNFKYFMSFLDMSRLVINKLIFMFDRLSNSGNTSPSILSQHAGKILEINLSNCLLRFIINKHGIFELTDCDLKNPSMIVTCNEPVINILKSVNNYDFSFSKFMHVSGDLQLMSDMSVILKNIERIFEYKSYEFIENFTSSITWIRNNICDFGFNLSRNFNLSFCDEFDLLADRLIYQDFENSLQSIYIDIKKTRIRINNLCKIINNLRNISC